MEFGSATCPRDVAYVPQTPWLQNETIRENVIFYGQFDKTRYDAVIEASGLAQDLEQLPASDLTFVGERVTSLSSGQKQRVSLARALYSRSSTLLLDDIFSALDTHTTTLVYEKCFRSGLLADRTVLLVTSFPAALQDAGMTICLEHGKLESVRESSGSPRAIEHVNLPKNQVRETDTDSSDDSSLSSQETDLSSNSITDIDQDQGQIGRIANEKSASGRVPRTLCKAYVESFGQSY